ESLIPAQCYQSDLFSCDLASTNPGTLESATRPKRLLEKLGSAKLRTGWVPLYLPSLPRENRRLHECIDIDDSQDWWPGSRVKKHLDEMHSGHLRRITALKKG